MTPDDVALVTSVPGRELVTGLTPYDESNALSAGARLRKAHPADLVAAVMTQARLRTRARDRFGDLAETLWFGPDQLEQATRPVVARHRAQRLAASGAKSVADIGCGMGLDTLAFAEAGLTVIAVDRDPLAVALCQANVEALGVTDHVTVVHADFDESFDVVRSCDAVFLDPARRSDGKRVQDPESWSPSWSAASSVASDAAFGLLKVAPGIDHDLPPANAETEWVSVNGSLVEACVRFGGAADSHVRRRATLLPDGITLTDTELATSPPPIAPVGAWIVEPDDAIIRAGLVAVIVDQLNGWLIDSHIAYVSSDTEPPESPTYARFRVTDVLPFNVKAIRALLREREVGRLEIKKRGAAVDPDDLRVQLKLDRKARGAATLIITRIGTEPIAFVAQRP